MICGVKIFTLGNTGYLRLNADTHAIGNKVGNMTTLSSSAVVLLRLHGQKVGRRRSYGIIRSAAVTYVIKFFCEGLEGFCHSLLANRSD